MLRIKKYAAALLAALVFCGLLLPVVANADSSVLRIAYWERGGRFEISEDGMLTGYDVELSETLFEDSGLKIEYVKCASPQDAVDALNDGRADLVSSMVETSARMDSYIFSAASTGLTYSGLIALDSRDDLVYRDYEAIKNCSVGYEGKSGKTDDYFDYLKNTRGIAKLKSYDSVTELREALDSGEIDLMATGANNIADNEKLIDKFGAEAVYYMSSKENSELMNTINDAMTKLTLHDSGYITRLEQKYFPIYYLSQYTKTELDYISDCPVLTVGVHSDWIPVIWQDDNGDFRGIFIDMMNNVSEYSGLKFRYEVIPDDVSNAEALQSGKYDLVAPVDPDISGIDGEENYITDALDSLHINLGVMKNRDLPDTNHLVIGVFGKLSELKGAVEKVYPEAEVQSFDSQSDALAALKSGKIDAIGNSTYVWYYLREMPSFDGIVLVPNETMSAEYCIGMAKTERNRLLLSILNTAVYSITSSERAGILAEYTTGQLYSMSFWDYAQEAAPFALFAIAIIVTLLILLILRSRYIRKLKAANTELERATKAKSQFLSNMSHDIRTPMNAVLNITELAYEDMDNKLKLKEDLDKIKTSGSFLLGLINDMLDMSYVENGNITLHPELYTYKEFCRYIESVIVPLCQKKNISFELKAGESSKDIFVDKTRFNQVFFNLLSNSAKYTDAGGKVTFSIENVIEHDGLASVDFITQDNGCGMSEEFQKRMFIPFERENTVEAYAGTGLGLSISKEIVEKMGGSISVESKKGIGTKVCVHLELPLANEEQRAAVKSKESLSVFKSQGKVKVLVAEDHPLNREIVVRLLKKHGLEAECAGDGEIALKMFEQSAPSYYSAVLMDIRMPNMDGLTSTGRIRALKRPDASTVPIIAMTANAFDEDIKKSISAGMNEHLSKPIDPALLFTTLDKYI